MLFCISFKVLGIILKANLGEGSLGIFGSKNTEIGLFIIFANF